MGGAGGSSCPPAQAADAERAVLEGALRSAAAALEDLGLGLLGVLDHVAGLEENALGDLAPLRRATEQELEIHAEVLELLTLRVGHHRAGLWIGLDGQSLLVPSDRLGLLGQ